MGKLRTSIKQETSILRSSEPVKTEKSKPISIEWSEEDFNALEIKKDLPGKFIRNKRNIGEAILECLLDNDPDGVMEMISTYLEAVNKSKMSKKNKLHRSTLYSAFKHKNPTIKTLAKIMYDQTHK